MNVQNCAYYTQLSCKKVQNCAYYIQLSIIAHNFFFEKKKESMRVKGVLNPNF